MWRSCRTAGQFGINHVAVAGDAKQCNAGLDIVGNDFRLLRTVDTNRSAGSITGRDVNRPGLGADVSARASIVRHAAKQNNQLLSIIDNHVVSSYCFWLDAEAWCSVMDKLLAEHRDVIESVLDRKQRADSVTLLAPYVGEIVGLKLFQRPQGVQKVDLIKSFSAFYGKPMTSIQQKLSTSYPAWYEFNVLVSVTLKLANCKRE